MFLRVQLIFTCVVMRMVGEHNHGVWVFATLFRRYTFKQRGHEQGRAIVRLSGIKPVCCFEGQVCIKENYQWVSRVSWPIPAYWVAQPRPSCFVRVSVPPAYPHIRTCAASPLPFS